MIIDSKGLEAAWASVRSIGFDVEPDAVAEILRAYLAATNAAPTAMQPEDGHAPCPWHGDNTELEIEDNGVGCFWVICHKDKCGCEGPYAHSVEEAWAKWDNRHSEAAAIITSLRAENERLAQANAALMVERSSIILTKREQIGRLTDERNNLADIVNSGIDDVAGAKLDVMEADLEADEARATTLQARLDAAVEALKPFARIAQQAIDEHGQDKLAVVPVSWLIKARAARQITQQGGGKPS